MIQSKPTNDQILVNLHIGRQHPIWFKVQRRTKMMGSIEKQWNKNIGNRTIYQTILCWESLFSIIPLSATRDLRGPHLTSTVQKSHQITAHFLNRVKLNPQTPFYRLKTIQKQQEIVPITTLTPIFDIYIFTHTSPLIKISQYENPHRVLRFMRIQN